MNLGTLCNMATYPYFTDGDIKVLKNLMNTFVLLYDRIFWAKKNDML
jgi:hypothetical protein